MTWVIGGLCVFATVAGWLEWFRRHHLVVTVRGLSMTPTLWPGDRVLVRCCSGRRVRTGQVAVVDLPRAIQSVPADASPEVDLLSRRVIKRVVAVANDSAPPFLAGRGAIVPPGSMVLLGDNPPASDDSRRFGYVPADAVVGIVRRTLPWRGPSPRPTAGGQ
jgi:signal peptidase I